ncbi:MAG: aminotransferase class V-fold PLP-dependent enzyme [Acidimicrobiia bacterium]|nr:aminotransferase class V-fold PLP-dependent enzyme [Acidimicrobiia bacterium]MDH4308956.1 aminotransferase class V-fold PLP-dependent enzyme [Acidimicrobiia bacterium]
MARWMLDPSVVYLNHGGFGGVLDVVADCQSEVRARMEANPTRFFTRDFPDLLDEQRMALGRFVGADPEGLAFVTNATAGVNTVLRSLRFERGDEILVTDHGYNACTNAARAVADAAGAVVVEAKIPFPVASSEQVVKAMTSAVTDRTRLVLVDHVTSPTALVFDVASIAEAVEGVPVLVDGAHGPGMVGFDIESLGVAFYTGNCHKWMCAPKGSAFLWVHESFRDEVEPLAISHGWNGMYPGGNRFRRLFDFTGTFDASSVLSVSTAIDAVGDLIEGGWPAVYRANHRLAVAGRRILLDAVGGDEGAPEAMVGSMASVVLPSGPEHLGARLAARHRIEIPVFGWRGARIVRLSAQLHNSEDQYRTLARAVIDLLDEEPIEP